jgi:hypothetical protein
LRQQPEIQLKTGSKKKLTTKLVKEGTKAANLRQIANGVKLKFETML